MPELPDWTEYCSNETEHRGLDPLGLESVGASIVQNQLLPGITNATRHIRYYTFFCWVFWQFWKGKAGKARLAEQKRWRVRLENILRAATLDKDEKIQALIGVTKAIRINGVPGKQTVAIDGGKAATAFVPANYSSSFRALGCGKDDKHGANITPFGEKLALAFDEALQSSPGARAALKEICSDASDISVASIRAIADGIRIRAVTAGEPEHKLLSEMLLRMETIDERENASFDLARSQTLALFMEIADQAQGSLASAVDLHRVFATGLLPTRTVFSVPAEFQHSFEMWKRYQERQYVKLSVYSLWHEVLQYLGSALFKTRTSQQLVAHFRTALRQSSVAETWLGKGSSQMTVGEALQTLTRQLSFTPREFGRKAIAIAESLKDLRTSARDRIGGAAVLLLLCRCYWEQNASTLPEGQLHKNGGTERISLESVHKDLGLLADITIADYLHWALENYVLKQATRVAVQKLPDYRFFIIRDEEGYRLVKERDPRSYLSYDSSRIGSAFELLAELKFVQINGAITLTAAGRKVLQKLRTFHETMNGAATAAAHA